jgi:PIN domain nuclease of toxin-antitoxin system
VLVLDTHALFWLFLDSKRLSRPAKQAIAEARVSVGIAISDITLWELASLAERRRIQISGSVERFIREISAGVAVKTNHARRLPQWRPACLPPIRETPRPADWIDRRRRRSVIWLPPISAFAILRSSRPFGSSLGADHSQRPAGSAPFLIPCWIAILSSTGVPPDARQIFACFRRAVNQLCSSTRRRRQIENCLGECDQPSFDQPQPRVETLDLNMYQRIRLEGLNHSHAMEYASALFDDIGPRLTGSQNLKHANEWTRDQFTAMGCSNAHLEDWGEFGMGWQQLNTWIRMTSPDMAVFIAQAGPWSPATNGAINARQFGSM